jgi:hypothetical protein
MTEHGLFKKLAIESAERFCRFRNEVLESSSLLKLEWLRRAGWVAVPRKQQGYVSMVDMERLARGLGDIGVAEVVVIYPADPHVECNCVAFPATLSGLMEAATAPAFTYLLTSFGDPLFVYHHTDEDFCLLAGPRQFVETAIGGSVEAGHHDWREYASHPGWSEAERGVYGDIERWYSEFSGKPRVS